ncbi:MAG: VIT domain-containing protein [Desulfofustis sp.]|jgi:Ca-activated chloride channel family protein|nr:VIT domain-containing protein [Desulfofustis sp.]
MYVPDQHAPGLHTSDGAVVPLKKVTVNVSFTNLLCESVITQTYRNREKHPIEAVYTFPLTSRAVLLDLSITIGERQLQGIVVEKRSAEERYEEAISDGDAAIMLEQVQPGLYTMNIGNILENEEVQISIRSAELYSWQDGCLRYHLPTTLAPRYGSPDQAGLQPHQVPEKDLLTEHRFQLRITLSGEISSATLASPSHHIAVAKDGGNTVVTLARGEAAMDRDFILNIQLPSAPPDTASVAADQDSGFVALASFIPRLDTAIPADPRSIKIVVDCSGSMAGDSIAQARQVLNDILKQLRPQDFFNIVVFGSTSRTYFDHQVPAGKDAITTVRRRLRNLEANLGGTEMYDALQTTVKLTGPAIPQDILLITDGEIWEEEEIFELMVASNHRVFAVGVGSAVSEGFLRRLAKMTGGACELVVPNEEMIEKIVRHFQRIFLSRAQVSVRWPQQPHQTIPSTLGPAFAGDTIHAFARFSEPPSGTVVCDIKTADGRAFTQTVELCPPSPQQRERMILSTDSLARMAIWRAIPETINEQESEALAVRYQLISPYTNYLAIVTRTEQERSTSLPQLRKVPHMLAAGWGGTGSCFALESPSIFDVISASQMSYDMDIFEALEELSPDEKDRLRQQATPEQFLRGCNGHNLTWPDTELAITTFADLQECSLPDSVIDTIRQIADSHDPAVEEDLVVLAFLLAIMNSPAGSIMNRSIKRAVTHAQKTRRPDQTLVQLMRGAFNTVSETDWGPMTADLT